MPLHLQSIAEETIQEGIFLWLLQDGMEKADSIFVSQNGLYLLIKTCIVDVISGESIGEIVYTVKKDDETQTLNILDLDIVISSDSMHEVEFISMLSGSGESNEYYEVETVDGGQHLEIETVNRHVEREPLEGTRRSLHFCAFPFRLSIYKNISEYNKVAGFNEKVQIGETEYHIEGYSLAFACPASMFNDNEDDHYSFMIGTVVSYRDVKVIFGDYKVDFVIAEVKTALGQIPVAMSRSVFDLSRLESGFVIVMKTDIKADLSSDDDFHIIGSMDRK